MIRLVLACVFLIAAGAILADDNKPCYEAKDCPCGSVCNDLICTKGCLLFDWFMAAGSEAVVYGRKCRCGDTPDDRGMLTECEDGVEFTGAPEGVLEWRNNPACEQPVTVATNKMNSVKAPVEELAVKVN